VGTGYNAADVSIEASLGGMRVDWKKREATLPLSRFSSYLSSRLGGFAVARYAPSAK